MDKYNFRLHIYDMSKTAVLISGEHRFLKQCLPTMKFAQDADLYFSFWNTSIIENSVLGINCEELIEATTFETYTDASRIIVEPSNQFQTIRYNDKMIYRWKRGIQMIKKSGIAYDKIIVTRPDLYFGSVNEAELNQTPNTSSLYVAWHRPNTFLQDCLFAGVPEVIFKLLDSLNIREWQTSEEHDWHSWWTNFVHNRLGLKTECAFPLSSSIFFRPSKKNNAQTFAEVVAAEHDWRDSKIIQFGEKWGYDGPIKSWGNEIVQHAINRFKSGAFNPEA